jgi:hypothetical protein
MCIKSVACHGCGEGVKSGTLYQCVAVHQLGFLESILFGGCECGEVDHPWIILQTHTHAYCPSCFSPLGDPDAVIKETDEPKEVKDVRWSEADHIIRRIKEPQNV